MPTNIRGGSKGGDRDFKTEEVRGIREDKGVVIGVVKVNSHPTRSGTIMVFVPTFSDQAREDDKTQWRSVKYATPFYSRTTQTNALGKTLDKSGDNLEAVKNTSGIMFPAPDVGTRVLCVFPEGRGADGFYFACAPDIYMVQSVPESSASTNFTKNPDLVRHTKAPTLEFNDTDNDVGKLSNFLTPKRALDTNTARVLKNQGLDQDEIRGLTTSSYTRETPSEVIGISTKGRRILQGGTKIEQTNINQTLAAGGDLNESQASAVEGRYARAKGHALVLDDGDMEGNNNLMRFRTAAGHQILLHDTEDLIYIGNSKGTAWIQMDSLGQVDVYSKTNINLRSQSMNFHTDGSMKFHAGSTIQMVAGANLHLEGVGMANLYSDKGPAFVYGGAGVHVKSGSGVNIQAGSMMNIKAASIIAIQGGCVALQSPAAAASKQNKAVQTDKKDTQPNAKGFWDADKDLRTSVDRVPTHEPYVEHQTTTQETVYTSIDVDDITGGATLNPSIPKSVSKKKTDGIDRVKSLTNDKKIVATVIAKENVANVALGKLDPKVTRNLAAGAATLAGSNGVHNFTNSLTGALGKYGATVENLQKNGLVRPEAFFNGQLTDDKLWTGKDGIDSAVAFLTSEFTQENMFYADIFNSMQDAYSYGAIDEADDVNTIAGMTMVSWATGDGEVATKYREGTYIDPRPIPGTTLVPDNNDMTSYYDDYFQTGVSAYVQSDTDDGLGYSDGWYDNFTGDKSVTGTVVTKTPGVNQTTTTVTQTSTGTSTTTETVTGGGSTTRSMSEERRRQLDESNKRDAQNARDRRAYIAKLKAETGLSKGALLAEARRREFK